MKKLIEIENYSCQYPDGTAALHQIDLSFEYGEKVALIGPNGAGKSSLLMAIAGFMKGQGQIRIDGIDVTEKNNKRIRKLIGCCFENPDDQLFMPTLREDVAFGPLNMGLNTEDVEKRVHEVLHRVGLEHAADKPPHHLSAGQKRAAAISTILAMSPKIITLDEPDCSLDARARNNLVSMLSELSQTLLIATCNIHFAGAIAKRAILIDEGRIIADGDAIQIMSDPKLMNAHGLDCIA